MTDLALVPRFRPFICPKCHFDIQSPEMHGWLRLPFGPETGWKTQIVRCDLCSEPAIAQRKAEQIARLLGQAHIPERMQHWSFTTSPGDVDQKAIARCANFANEQSQERGLYLYGDFGSGKTGLAISIIQAAMYRGEDAVFIRSLDLMNRLRQSIAKGEDDDLLWMVKTVRWLALDDLATERPTDFVIERLQDILESRRDRGLLTVITSNFNLGELEARWRSYRDANGQPVEIRAGTMHAGRRVVERIAEYCHGVPLKSRNLRQKQDDDGKVKPIRGN